jgi:hypothetical protein
MSQLMFEYYLMLVLSAIFLSQALSKPTNLVVGTVISVIAVGAKYVLSGG